MAGGKPGDGQRTRPAWLGLSRVPHNLLNSLPNTNPQDCLKFPATPFLTAKISVRIRVGMPATPRRRGSAPLLRRISSSHPSLTCILPPTPPTATKRPCRGHELWSCHLPARRSPLPPGGHRHRCSALQHRRWIACHMELWCSGPASTTPQLANAPAVLLFWTR